MNCDVDASHSIYIRPYIIRENNKWNEKEIISSRSIEHKMFNITKQVCFVVDKAESSDRSDVKDKKDLELMHSLNLIARIQMQNVVCRPVPLHHNF
jgi:hypothetical protein